MAISPPKQPLTNPYPRNKIGHYGELGQGAGVTIKFLQTAILHSELDNLDLIENIPGSDKWDVRDLFQRTVDKERVSKSILPYLQDDTKVKFFNPLTLILLPFDTKSNDIEKDLRYVEPRPESKDGHEFEVFEIEGAYRFHVHKTDPAYSYVEWNEQRVKVVAIDGQHRLSALKMWKSDPNRGSEFTSWSIPVVMLAMFKETEDSNPPTILEVVRKTFVYINSTAEAINESRKILLDDESVNCICSQEVVQHAHENDQMNISDIDAERIPLMFFDWRGEVRNNRHVPGPATIKSVEEVRDWFGNYILGEDGSSTQEANLNLEDVVPPIESIGPGKKLSTDDAARVRLQFKSHLLPAFCYVMENFDPYKKYITECRQKQYRDESEDPIAKFAYQKICFGSYNVGNDLVTSVENMYREIVSDFIQIKHSAFHELIARDVGMRSVWSAFGTLKVIKDQLESQTSSWLEFAEWFVPLVNKIYTDGWFRSANDLAKQQLKFLTHVVYDTAGGIINYRHSDVKDALATFISLLIVKESGIQELQDSCWEELNVNFRKPLKKGFKKAVTAQLRNTFSGNQSDFNREVIQQTEKETNKRIGQLKTFLD